MIPVVEIFGPTIQGEGPHVGMKTLFVRVAGCDFKCEWCDSKFAWEFNNATKYEPEELAETLIYECLVTNTSNVVLTGGNPCLYDFEEVISKLHDRDITVDVETQGSLFPAWVSQVDLLVISPKAPSSKQPDVASKVSEYLRTLYTREENRNQQIAIKIPVFDDADFEFAKRYYDMLKGFRMGHWFNVNLYLSVGNTDTIELGSIALRVLNDYEKLIDKVAKSDMKRVFILPQVHTLVWGNRQGV